MNEQMKQAWLEISQMLGEPTREELDVFLRTWQRASQATLEALAEQPAQQEYERGFIDGMQEQMRRSVDRAVNAMAQRTWVGLTDEDIDYLCELAYENDEELILTVQAKLKEKNQ